MALRRRRNSVAQDAEPLPPSPTSDASFLRSLLLEAGKALAFFVVGLAVTYVVFGESAVIARMTATFESGGVLSGGWLPWGSSTTHLDLYLRVDTGAKVPRPQLVAELALLLRPHTTDQYALVIGESGTGKSTAVRTAIRSLPYPKGVIYFSAPTPVTSFSEELALSTGFFHALDPLASFYNWWGGQAGKQVSAASDAHWAVLRRKLQAAAASFRAIHGRPAVLVIDDADYVAKQDLPFFLRLQEFAKVCADGGSLRIVFVSSEGTALPIMEAASASSRAQLPFEVQDISDPEAVDYLVSRGVDALCAEEAVRDITGGRFALLLRIASAAAGVKGISATRDELYIKSNLTLLELDLTPMHPFFRELDASKHIPVTRAFALLREKGKLDALLRNNIVSRHPDGTLTTNSRHVEVFIREAIAFAEEVKKAL